MSRRKRADPVTLVRAPMFAKRTFSSSVKASSPASLSRRGMSGTVRGRVPATACAPSSACPRNCAARANAFRWNLDPAYKPAKPAQLGVQAFDIDLAELVDFIDWGPFFQTWDLACSYPKILADEIVSGLDVSSQAQVWRLAVR